jgi:hypothetical protein
MSERVTAKRIERAIKLEDLALNQVRKRFSHIRRQGFSAAIRSLSPLLQSYRCGFVPDGWFVEHDTYGEIGEFSIFTCVEIEDTNPLSPGKLWKYRQLWLDLSAFSRSPRRQRMYR